MIFDVFIVLSDNVFISFIAVTWQNMDFFGGGDHTEITAHPPVLQVAGDLPDELPLR